MAVHRRWSKSEKQLLWDHIEQHKGPNGIYCLNREQAFQDFVEEWERTHTTSDKPLDSSKVLNGVRVMAGQLGCSRNELLRRGPVACEKRQSKRAAKRSDNRGQDQLLGLEGGSKATSTHLGQADGNLDFERSSSVTVDHEIGQKWLVSAADSSSHSQHRPTIVSSADPIQTPLVGLCNEGTLLSVDSAGVALASSPLSSNHPNAKGLSRSNQPRQNDRYSHSSTTINKSELQVLEAIRAVQHRHMQHEQPPAQVIRDRVCDLDNRIREAVSLFIEPYQSLAFQLTRLSLTDDTLALSKLLFGHQPHANGEDVMASVLDVQGLRMPTVSIVLRAYIAAALNQWVFRVNLRRGCSPDYWGRQMESFIGRVSEELLLAAQREAFSNFLDDFVEPSLTSRSEALRDRLDAVLVGIICGPSRERRENLDEGNPVWVTTDGYRELRRKWRKKLADIFEKAFGLHLLLERSPLDYFYDFPAYLDDYDTNFMEIHGATADRESSQVCLCLRQAIKSRPKPLRGSPTHAVNVIVPALVLLL